MSVHEENQTMYEIWLHIYLSTSSSPVLLI